MKPFVAVYNHGSCRHILLLQLLLFGPLLSAGSSFLLHPPPFVVCCCTAEVGANSTLDFAALGRHIGVHILCWPPEANA